MVLILHSFLRTSGYEPGGCWKDFRGEQVAWLKDWKALLAEYVEEREGTQPR